MTWCNCYENKAFDAFVFEKTPAVASGLGG